jgi:hypothetical protein
LTHMFAVHREYARTFKIVPCLNRYPNRLTSQQMPRVKVTA